MVVRRILSKVLDWNKEKRLERERQEEAFEWQIDDIVTEMVENGSFNNLLDTCMRTRGKVK